MNVFPDVLMEECGVELKVYAPSTLYKLIPLRTGKRAVARVAYGSLDITSLQRDE